MMNLAQKYILCLGCKPKPVPLEPSKLVTKADTSFHRMLIEIQQYQLIKEKRKRRITGNGESWVIEAWYIHTWWTYKGQCDTCGYCWDEVQQLTHHEAQAGCEPYDWPGNSREPAITYLSVLEKENRITTEWVDQPSTAKRVA